MYAKCSSGLNVKVKFTAVVGSPDPWFAFTIPVELIFNLEIEEQMIFNL